jgi:hypothetical protein
MPLQVLSCRLHKVADNEIYISEAIRELDADCFFCKASGEVGTKEETICGRLCEDYEPRNGIKGCCKYRGYCYVPGEKRFILKNNGKISLIK